MSLKEHHKPFSHEGNKDIGVVVIHGFTSTTSSVMPLAEAFAKEDYHVEVPTLHGHGSDWQDLNKITYRQWIEQVRAAYFKIAARADRVFVCGLSLGGTLSLYLAQKYPAISGLILINNACILKKPGLFFLPIFRFIIPSIPGIASDIKKPLNKEIAYDRTPLKGLYQLVKLMRITRKKLHRIHQPALIFKSVEDHVVPMASATYTLKKIRSTDKQLIMLKDSYHVATLDNDAEKIITKSVEFIERISKQEN